MKTTILLFAIAILLQSCGGSADKANDQSEVEQNTETPSLLIEETKFYGIEIGMKIADLNLEKSLLETGEGSFEIFLMKDKDGKQLGHIYADTREGYENLVGSIHITSTDAHTKEGLHPGMTFGELEAIVPDLEVYGSEIEGYTYANAGKFTCSLDFNHWSVELDKKEVPKETKVTDIVVM